MEQLHRVLREEGPAQAPVHTVFIRLISDFGQISKGQDDVARLRMRECPTGQVIEELPVRNCRKQYKRQWWRPVGVNIVRE